jgi:hypothetical protein
MLGRVRAGIEFFPPLQQVRKSKRVKMADDEKKISVAVPGEWALQKVLGPILDEIGSDFQKLYSAGRDKIVQAALRKIKSPEDGARANLRVARDVFWNGSFTDEGICAEYFGGILAASRSKDGKNDLGVFYVDIIKSMSSGQLKMHYLIYRTLNKFFIADENKKGMNPGQESELSGERLIIPLGGIDQQFESEDLGAIFHGLNAKNLIGYFQTDFYKLEGERGVWYLTVEPKTLGIQLFAIANNRFLDWKDFSTMDFGDFGEVDLPKIYGKTIESVIEKAGLKPNKEKSGPTFLVPTA